MYSYVQWEKIIMFIEMHDFRLRRPVNKVLFLLGFVVRYRRFGEPVGTIFECQADFLDLMAFEEGIS
jgi:hypothetical protein